LRTGSSFIERLQRAARSNDSWLCIGLDPDPALAPAALGGGEAAAWVPRFLGGIVEATADLVCCYKPNLAFFEALGLGGQQALRQVLAALPPEIPLLIDAKRGDIGHTMAAYARAIFDDLGADAVTLNPYLGGDALAPFLEHAGRGVFVVCKTSNPGAAEIQDLLVEGEPLFMRVARQALGWPHAAALGLVVGATYPRDVAAVRHLAPEVPILLPGVGAQAGDLEAAVGAGASPTGGGLLVNASRSILYASSGADWQAAAREAALRLRADINRARSVSATPTR
jgi:orotidine-5'-phosphate decarboxylase